MELNGTIQGSGALTGSFDFDQADYNLLKNKPSINGVVLVGNKTSEDLHINAGGGGTTDYNDLTNKPQINGVGLTGNKTANDLNLQEKITFSQDPTQYLDGEGNFTTPDYFSGDYEDLSNIPQINGITLTGNKTADDLNISNKAHIEELSGALVQFQNGQDIPLIKCIADIEPIQSGSGTPSTSNPRPITGWTDVTITVSNNDETETYTAALGQTVYGGQLNVITGELIITHKIVTFNGTEQWSFVVGQNTNRAYITVSDIGANTNRMDIYSNQYVAKEYNGMDTIPPAITNRSGIAQINIFQTQYATVEEFKAAIQNEPLQVVYPIANPQTVQLTPQKPKSIIGDNNIESDTGDIDITYINNINDPAIIYIINNL